MSLKALLTKDTEHVIFNGNYMEAYIPEYYFEGKMGIDKGTSVEVFGLFSVRVFNGDTPGKLKTINAPYMINIYPSEMESADLELVPGVVQRYRVCKFYKGSKFMDKNVRQDSANVELFINMLFRGNMPRTTPYGEKNTIWMTNLSENGVNLGVSSPVRELILAEIDRNKNKPEEKFAKVIGSNPKVSEYDYEPANIREICARNSTFAALTFEDMDAMITTSLNISRYNKEESESPIEKIIKM